MKHLFIIAALCGVAACSQAVNSTSDFANASENQTASLRNLIIFYDTQVGEKALLKAVADYKAELIYHYQQLHGIAIRLPEGKAVNEAIRHFEQVQGVLGVQQDQVNQLH